MLNNIHFVALHVFDVHNAFFAVSIQGHLVKFALLMLLAGSLVEFAAPHVCLLNQSTQSLKARQPV